MTNANKTILIAIDEFVFHVISKGDKPPGKRNYGVLLIDNWDDWGKYATQYSLSIIDQNGDTHSIGSVKIGERGLQPSPNTKNGMRRPNVPTKFMSLNDALFSLGQDDEYYENMKSIAKSDRIQIFQALNDIAYNTDLLYLYKEEPVMTESLLRSVVFASVEDQYHRIAIGGDKRTNYSFSFLVSQDTRPPLELSFSVRPSSRPPSNIQVIIGRNGVGKSRILTAMATAINEEKASGNNAGCFSWDSITQGGKGAFSQTLAVSFSAFDQHHRRIESRHNDQKGVVYIGLKDLVGRPVESGGSVEHPFVESLKNCRSSGRRELWLDAIQTLGADPIFNSLHLDEYILNSNTNSKAESTFDSLSSGHKIVLLSISKIVEHIAEKCLVLFDEPETHLHPPLLSSYIRALSDLLISKNGVAIIATHSPVILQEVPKSCVWVIDRLSDDAWATRPERETFGENVGTLTREVFQLEASRSGYHQLLNRAVSKTGSFDQALDEFDSPPGSEAMALLQSMVFSKQKKQ